jgi:dienelactone hydrolase
VDFGVFTMPGAFTPTGSDVDVEVRFLGQIQEEGLLCGDVTGAIVTFGFDLEGSTFGAVTAGPEAQIQSSCQAGQGALLPRVQAEDCPALAPGTVEGFASAGRSRSFELIAPEGVDEDTALPLVFVFHGIGDSPGGILGRSELRQMAQEQGFMIAAPAGFEIDGTATWNVVSPENEDVAFFDDMLTCLGASFNVDQDRVYVAGHSNGGLFASNLLRLRSERLAAAAPISGGWFTELDSAQRPLPVMVTWGGSADMAFNQDFHQRSLDLIEGLRADGHFVVACDHGQGHLFPEETWGWLVQFLLAHDLQSVDSPLAQGLPEGFPSYCEVSP